MLSVNILGNKLQSLGFNFFSGVPCSYLMPLINYAMSEQDYLAAVNEGDAVAHCAGAWLGGRKSVVLMQNSGLGNAVSPLTSLNAPFKIPVLGFISHRGAPEISDEPQHQLMGPITEAMLSTMQIKHQVLSNDATIASKQLKEADHFIEQGESYFFIVKKNTFDDYPLNNASLPIGKNSHYKEYTTPTKHTRTEMLSTLKHHSDKQTVTIATTGITGRELYQLGHHPSQLYMVGSMGCVSALGLGLAKACPQLKVIAIDGDGALLMRMGNLATAGNYQLKNFCHVLLDNGVHESTGGQETVAQGVNFAQIAQACGYNSVYAITTPEQMATEINNWFQNPTNCFITSKIIPGYPKPLARPKERPAEIADSFKKHIKKILAGDESPSTIIPKDKVPTLQRDSQAKEALSL